MRSDFLPNLFRVFVAGLVAGMMAAGGISRAQSEQMTPVLKEKLYQDETTIHGPTEPAFSSYWSDETDVIWWDSINPVVSTGHFTDGYGRKLVVTTIHAAPLCDIAGCLVRIQTEQGEKLLDRVYACDLAEDHHFTDLHRMRREISNSETCCWRIAARQSFRLRF